MNTEVSKWLSELDSGNEVKSVLMGGISEGYELAIQALAIETLRILQGIKLPEDSEKIGMAVSLAADTCVDSLDKKFGFSGAQVGAAKNIASVFWKQYKGTCNLIGTH